MIKEAFVLPAMSVVDYARYRLSNSDDYPCSAHMSLCLSTLRGDTNIHLGDILNNRSMSLWSQLRRIANIYDDYLDEDPKNIPSIREFKNLTSDGESINDIISKLVSTVFELKLADDNDKGNIFRTLGNFRREQYKINTSLAAELSNKNPDFAIIEELKLDSTGHLMASFSDVFFYSLSIDDETREEARDALYWYGRAGQIVDDLADLRRDQGHPHNLVVNSAKMFGEIETLRNSGFSRRGLKKCPQTLRYISDRFREELSQIPDDFSLSRFSLKVCKKVVGLYSAFETEPEVIT